MGGAQALDDRHLEGIGTCQKGYGVTRTDILVPAHFRNLECGAGQNMTAPRGNWKRR
jgi:hypothetical protein